MSFCRVDGYLVGDGDDDDLLDDYPTPYDEGFDLNLTELPNKFGMKSCPPKNGVITISSLCLKK